ncbi:MAG: SGNH/GDSL hydrolase family protein [Bacteroidota bacterium]|nr:SGNH/GDSL hydrolase family protein [Bacteroidota bacterium]|tara:strand:- start:1876 stop:2565 length:690 start_codon:yes stop_codon:yes gene_type:complete
MKKYILLFILLFMTSCNQNVKQVVFLGDSITQNAVINSENFKGYITLIQEEVDENIKLIGRGISGDKVSDLLTRYKEDVLKLNPDIVFIYIGINDVWHKYDFGTGTDIDLYENGLRKIISDVKNQGAKVVLCTPTVIGENSGEFRLGNQFKDVETMEKMDQDLDDFSDIIRKLSSEYNTELVDLRKAFKQYISENNPENKAKGILTTDGVHLNNKGSKLIAENMLNHIN